MSTLMQMLVSVVMCAACCSATFAQKCNSSSNPRWTESVYYVDADCAAEFLAPNKRLIVSLAYNNRMMLTQWNIPGVLGYSYRYDNYGENNTGRVTFADNLTNGASRDATLDRSWYYDSVGRLDVAYTGSEARATIGTDTWGHPDGPYAQDFNYDVWGNITSRVGWGGWNAQYTATFNNKNQMVTNPANGLAFTSS